MNNRIYNADNPYQGKTKKVLCVCSAGLLRSPTAAHVLSAPPYNLNTRCAGIDVGHALVPVDEVLVSWADEILVMDQQQMTLIMKQFQDYLDGKTILVLNIADSYEYRDPELVAKITKAYDEHLAKV